MAKQGLNIKAIDRMVEDTIYADYEKSILHKHHLYIFSNYCVAKIDMNAFVTNVPNSKIEGKIYQKFLEFDKPVAIHNKMLGLILRNELEIEEINEAHILYKEGIKIDLKYYENLVIHRYKKILDEINCLTPVNAESANIVGFYGSNIMRNTIYLLDILNINKKDRYILGYAAKQADILEPSLIDQNKKKDKELYMQCTCNYDGYEHAIYWPFLPVYNK